MKKTGRSNALLIELVIMLLFFSLSASVILQVFVGARDRSVRSAVDSGATFLAEDVSARFSVSRLPATAFFADDGFLAEGEGYAREESIEGVTLRLFARGDQEQTDAGVLDEWTLAIYEGERLILTMPMARYTQGEGSA